MQESDAKKDGPEEKTTPAPARGNCEGEQAEIEEPFVAQGPGDVQSNSIREVTCVDGGFKEYCAQAPSDDFEEELNGRDVETPVGVDRHSEHNQRDGEPVERNDAKDAADVELFPIGPAFLLEELGVEEVARDHEKHGDAEGAEEQVEARRRGLPCAGAQIVVIDGGVMEEDAERKKSAQAVERADAICGWSRRRETAASRRWLAVIRFQERTAKRKSSRAIALHEGSALRNHRLRDQPILT